MKKLISSFAMVLGFAVSAMAQPFPSGSGYKSYSGFLSNETALSYNKQFSIDLAPYNANDVGASVLYGSATIADVTFVGGSQSTGAVAVVNYLGLSTAAATDQITIVSTTNLGGAQIRVNNTVLVNGTDWFTGTTKQLTAVSLAAAIGTISNISASAAGGIVYATAAAGSFANSWVCSSNNSSATVATATFIGGADAAVFTLNGVALTSGKDWFASVSSVTTVISLSSAINNNSSLNTVVTASTGVISSSEVVNIQSLLDGAQYNYTMQTSTPLALSLILNRVSSTTLLSTPMINGVTPQDTLGSSTFKLGVAHNLTLGLPVLYSTGTVGANKAIGGLTNQTTYYAVPVTSYYFQLALYSTSAVAGSPASDFITVTGTTTQTNGTMPTYTLHPLAIAGTPGFKWQVSNDNSNWIDLSVSSVTVTSYTSGGALAGWDFGSLGLRYLRLNTTAPTAGGLVLQTVINLKQ